jgi:PAS domain S-box-containing protein
VNDISERKQAEEVLRRSAGRDAFRVALGDALRPLSSPEQIKATAVRVLGEYLGVSRANYAEVIANAEQVLVEQGYTDGVAPIEGTFLLKVYGRELSTDHAAGRTLVEPNIPNSKRLTDVEKSAYRALNIAAHIDVPLIKEGQFVGLLFVHQSTPRGWRAEDIELVEETAERIWSAVQHVRSEEAFHMSEARYRSLFKTIDEGFCIIEMIYDEQGQPTDYRFVDLNPAFEKHTGLVNAIGRTARDLVPGLEKHWVEIYGRVALTRQPERFQNRAEAMNERWFEVYAFPYAEQQVGLLFSDITARKKAESARDALFEAEQQARLEVETAQRGLEFLVEASTLLSASLDYETTFLHLATLLVPARSDVYLLDLVDGSTGKLRRVALKAVDAGQEVILREMTDRFGIDKYALTAQHVLDTGQPLLLEAVTEDTFFNAVEDKDHLSLLMQLGISSVVSVPLLIRTELIGVFTLLMTTSGRKYSADDLTFVQELARRVAQAVDNARLYEEAQKAVSKRDEFLSVAAHELKTPVTGMLGFAQLLLRRLSKGRTVEPEQLQHGLEQIALQADKLTRFINQLLDVSRLQAGRLTLQPQQIDLVSLVQDVARSAQIRTNRHTLLLDAPRSLLLLVDPLRIEQVLVNLVDNAVKYSPNGGPIKVAVYSTEKNVFVSVTDQGVGVRPEHRPHIFDRFYQAHSTGYLGGMGLGLYISRQVMELHNGELTAQFPATGGTCMIMRLPVHPSDAETMNKMSAD